MAENSQIVAMRKLGFSEEEIADVLKSDAEIDKGAKHFELTPEQEKASKEARATKQRTVYDFKPRERKKDEPKRELMNALAECARSVGEMVEVTNPERELEFFYNGKKYRVTLSAPRK
jgi:sugar/nucleoside kinase (ribokinase family)